MEPSSNSNLGLLVVICGPSGVGKSTIANRLRDEHGLAMVLSATTRDERPGDDLGKKYEYVTREEFFRRLDADEFLEYAEVYGSYYGTPRRRALEPLAAGRDVLLEIDVQGALQIRFQYPDALLIFILPPDAPTLLQRLAGRGRDSDEEVQKRYRAAKREIQMAKGAHAFDFFVINDTVDRAVAEIVKIIKHKRSGGI